MKICFFSGDISKTGGTERVCLLIANELSMKHEVSILSFKNGSKATFECNSNVDLYSLNLENTKGYLSRKIIPYVRLYRFLKKHPQDVIINVDIIYSLYTIPMKLFYKTKIIGWEHFNCHINNGVKNRDRARKLAAKYADAIVTLTEKDKNDYQKMYNVKSYIDYIVNPSISLYDKSVKRDNIVLACGRLCYQKNFQELLEIWHLISDDYNEWKLMICGDGEDRNELESIIEQYKLNNVVLAGNQSNMKKIYNSSKIMVMTSRFEGLPMVLLEAQGCGLPIISYDCLTGPSEIITSDNGFLIPYGDKNEFANKLNILLKDSNLRHKMGDNAIKSSKRFDIEEIVKKWYKFLELIYKK